MIDPAHMTLQLVTPTLCMWHSPLHYWQPVVFQVQSWQFQPVQLCLRSSLWPVPHCWCYTVLQVFVPSHHIPDGNMKLEECMWEARQLQDASTHRLEGANGLAKIKDTFKRLECQDQQRAAHMECGCPTWKGGDVTGQVMDAYYIDMTTVVSSN